MIKTLFFDIDCLCAFLWVGYEGLLPQLYPGRIIIPRPVYTELCNPRIPHLRSRTDALLRRKQAAVQELHIDSAEYGTYFQLTEAPEKGHPLIGSGEAAAISLAKQYNGIVASNNLRDISSYISEFSLEHITVGIILVNACHNGLITEEGGNTIWAQMLARRRRLGAPTFTDYLNQQSLIP